MGGPLAARKEYVARPRPAIHPWTTVIDAGMLFGEEDQSNVLSLGARIRDFTADLPTGGVPTDVYQAVFALLLTEALVESSRAMRATRVLVSPLGPRGRNVSLEWVGHSNRGDRPTTCSLSGVDARAVEVDLPDRARRPLPDRGVICETAVDRSTGAEVQVMQPRLFAVRATTVNASSGTRTPQGLRTATRCAGPWSLTRRVRSVARSSVKMLLRDAKFYIDPASDTARRRLAYAAATARRDGSTRARFQADQELTKPKSAEAWKDADVLEPSGHQRRVVVCGLTPKRTLEE